MKLYIATSFILVKLLSIVHATKDCQRPDDIKIQEDRCLAEHVELIDRLQQTSRSVLNFAKKKLGMTTDAENGPQKCEYYECIFKHLNMLNANDYPIYDNIVTWIEDHIIMNQGKELIDRLQQCNDALGNATVSDRNFYANQITIQYSYENNTESPNLQSTCERNAEFMKCLSTGNECSTFAYP